MNVTWDGDGEDTSRPISAGGWLRVVLRAVALVTILLAGVVVKLLLRLVEYPIYREKRPISPWVTKTVCRMALAVMGLRLRVVGQPMKTRGAWVANHASWLDIFVLNAVKTVYFVSKAEVAGWPGIGFLAKITGTLFIARDPRQAKAQTALFVERLKAGHRLVFFPEGTSTDGFRVLPFKTTLFQSFFTDDLRPDMAIQPISVIYHAPPGEGPRFYGWWGDMGFGEHLLKTLSARHRGVVDLRYHAPVKVADVADRKALARQLEDAVRAGMPEARRAAG
ncbi:lysophospholipid acyltransferase family protein [Roseovarius sp. C7]|uniref:lysophospholipid acyltransferase family protein n=1 Tax=Roseovarius sp. C7 TaxID=3398643 RepID=UPI0039F5F965